MQIRAEDFRHEHAHELALMVQEQERVTRSNQQVIESANRLSSHLEKMYADSKSLLSAAVRLSAESNDRTAAVVDAAKKELSDSLQSVQRAHEDDYQKALAVISELQQRLQLELYKKEVEDWSRECERRINLSIKNARSKSWIDKFFFVFSKQNLAIDTPPKPSQNAAFKGEKHGNQR